MKNKVIIYVGLLIAFIVFFVGGYYAALLLGVPVGVRKAGPAVPMDIEAEDGLLLPRQDSYVLYGYIAAVDKEKSPIEMSFYVDLYAGFHNAPYSMIERKILLDENTSIVVGPQHLPEEKERRVAADTDVLKAGRHVVVNTEENVMWILEKEIFVAEEIKVIVSEDEYQDYLR